MRKIACSLIEQLSFNYTNPTRASRLMRDYLSCAIRVTNATLTKNMMMKFRNHKVGFREVEEIADKLLSQQKNVENSRAKKYGIVKDMMKHKLNNAIDYEKVVRKQLKVSKDDLDKNSQNWNNC